ncbi:ankyrin repeat domain-containing protein 40 isoform X1 [Paramormyrops kingsleyae]|uniref:Ankyrin repeat domain 40 n=1 Tax=Paramormyrops kingsleyae TaxID=1676925 RepID=A0A3B3S0Q1_9TELE|nr:ankyrin repeat domain-containing protein 40 isoform X1 [Paramormyrops kingsleyae]
MSTLSLDKGMQERLREASAIGDIDEVRALVESGVNVNSQNEINGWTCLHWACKRNHKPIVAYLLNSGADKDVLTSKGELAVQLTSKPDIRRLLGVEEDVPEVKEPELPIIPNYLSNPPFPYGTSDTDDLILAPHTFQNGTANRQPYSEPVTSLPSPPDLSPASLISYEREESLFVDPENSKEGAGQNGLMPDPPGAMNGVLSGAHCSRNGEHSHAASPIEPVHPVPPAAGGSAGSQAANPTVTRQQSIPQQLSCGPPGVSVPAFQPFFFTSTFPVNVQELVLKVRIQNPNARENDFIEVELDRQELTYRSLLRVCCRELGISADHVEKIRKLPNTMLRKDKDVARLQDFQELEVVLERMEGLSLLSGVGHGGLGDRPCYNMKASKLTY